MASQERRFLPLPFFLALVGILFSLWNLMGDASALCVTEGCSLFRDFSLAGVSMWWLGVAGFSVLLLAAIPGFSGAGMALAGLGLALDCLLLAIMLATAPCFSCLIVGLLLALVFVSFRWTVRQEQHRRGPASLSPLLAVWTLLFVVDAGCIVRDAVGPWMLTVTPAQSVQTTQAGPVEEPQAVAVQIYFSPSCSACLTLVRAYDAGRSGAAAWYPVAENARDLLIIDDMRRRMDEGAPLGKAVEAALAAAPEKASSAALVRPGMLWLQFRLWRNSAHVLNAGSPRLPFVEFHGLPAGLTAPSASAPAGPSSSPSGSSVSSAPYVSSPASGAMPFLDVAGFCDGGDEPCAAPDGTSGQGTSLSGMMGETPAN